MTQKLFLSYKREDNKDSFVEKLYNALTDKGYDVWWDMQSMPHRQLTFLQNIRDAIAERDRVILVGSKIAYESLYVKAEYDYALSVCKPVHTIMRNDAYTDIPETLRDKDVPDFKDDANFDNDFAHLLRHLEDNIAPLGTIHGTRPALPAWYIERDNIMGKLDNMVLSDAKKPVVVTSKKQVNALHGMGGIGKTTVANAFSERCTTRRYFPDGIFWVTLGKNPDITFQQSNIGKIFGDDPKEYLSPEKGLARLQMLLSDKKVLFVLDDVWEKDHADAFRIQGNFTRTLITSRQQDLVTQIAALSAEVDKLAIEEGLRLFDARLVNEEGNPRKPENRKHETIERQIIELLDGYTLAVELASAQLAKKGEDYAERLLERLQKMDNSDNPFRSLKLEGNNKNANIELSLAISYEELNEDEQERFRNLGILAPNAPFTLDLMQTLWGDKDDEDSEDALDKLNNLALIARDENGLYEQHTVLRAYATALLKREEEYENSYHGYLKYITELTWQFDQLPPEKWRKLDDVLSQILYVGDTLAEAYQNNDTLADIAYEFYSNTIKFVFRRIEMKRKIWLEKGLYLAQQRDDTKRQARFWLSIGYFHDEIGEKRTALHHYNQAYALYEKVGYKRGQADALNNIGVVYRSSGKLQEALDTYKLARPIYRELKNKDGEAGILNNIGAVYNEQNKKDKALDYFEKALVIIREVGSKVDVAAILNNIGRVYYSQGKNKKALCYYKKALPIYHEAKIKKNEANVLKNIGFAHNALEEKEEALDYYNQAIDVFREIEDKFNEFLLLADTAVFLYSEDNIDDAINYMSQSVALGEKISHPNTEVYKSHLAKWQQERDAGA